MRLRVARSTVMGTCQSLKKQDEQQIQTLAFTILSESDKTCSVHRVGNISGDLVIPASVHDGNEEYLVTEIEDYAFIECWGIKSVNIPNSIVSIGLSAFDDTNISSLVIPSSVTSINSEAFGNCKYLKEIIIEDGEVTLNVGKNLFNDNHLFLLFTLKEIIN